MPFPRSVGVLGVVVTLVLTLAACSGGDDAATPTPSKSPSTSAPTTQQRKPEAPTVRTQPPVSLHGQWPLTGEALTKGLPRHPVYVVKIDNTDNSTPQVGLQAADLVVEELVEGGLTRLAAFYYSDIPGLVGPVRSARASDVGVVKPTNGYLVMSGAAHPTFRVLRNAGISVRSEGTAGFYRASNRRAPYNLMMRLQDLARATRPGWQPPQHPYLRFGGSFHGKQKVTSITAGFSGTHATRWKHTDHGWVRTTSHATTGQDFRTNTVLLLRVPIGNAGYLDPAGNPVPETKLYGEGRAVLVHGTRAVEGTWHKDRPGGEIRLTTGHGKSLAVPPGHVFIELIPSTTGSITLRK